MRRFGPRGGFSLIELLIVVAIIAALVGVAVPFFQDNLTEAQRSKAGQDLDVLRQAVSLYEQKEGSLLTGTSLQPLLGRYVGEIPVDPWGNDYLFDGAVGFLGTYGADALPGGSGADGDLVRGGVTSTQAGQSYAISPVFLRRVQYQGPWGRPRRSSQGDGDFAGGNKFVFSFTRPLFEREPVVTPEDFLLNFTDSSGSGSYSVPLSDTTSWISQTWRSARDPAYVFPGNVDPAHRPDQGVVILRAFEDNRAVSSSLAIRPDMRVSTRSDDEPPGLVSLTTTYSAGADPASPLDPSVYGPKTSIYNALMLAPPSAELGGPADEGVKIERY